MIVIRMKVDNKDVVYGVDFIDCMVQLERVGAFPNDTLPHVCEFTALSVDSREYKTLMVAANDTTKIKTA